MAQRLKSNGFAMKLAIVKSSTQSQQLNEKSKTWSPENIG